jgi:uncharacterized repeat protein (TIGR01451 family)
MESRHVPALINRRGRPSHPRTTRSILIRMLLPLLLLFGGHAYAATCGYAAPTALGKYAGALCFFDLTSYDEATASSAAGQNFTMTLPTGGTFAFNVKRTNGTAVGGGTPNAPLRAAAVPTYSGAALGNGNWYAGIPGRPVLYQTAGGTTSVLTFTNFVVSNPDGSPVTNFDFIAADGETTSAPNESFSLSTDGTAWKEIDRSGSNLVYTGLGTQNLSWRSPGGNASAPILLSRSPTQVVATLVGGGLQGMTFALAATTLSVAKNVADPHQTGLGRAGAGDEFALSITNSSGSAFDLRGRATTTGTVIGTQSAQAQALIYFSGPINVSETMAPGSTSALGVYNPTTTCTSTSGETTGLPTNASGGAVTLTTLNPGNFDLIRCTITNTIPQPQVSIAKSASTNALPPGGAITYTVTVANTGQVPAIGTVVNDPIPAGIAAFAWTCTASGGAVCPNSSGSGAISETVATFPPGGQLVYRINATVAANPPASVINTGTANPPHGTCFPDASAPPCAASVSNPSTPIVAITKTAGSPQAVPGSTVTYDVTVRNPGSVSAGGTVVDDVIPAGLTTPFTWTCNASGGAACPNASGSGAIHETLATFPPGGEVVYTITATVVANPPAALVNRGTATPPTGGVCADGSAPPCVAVASIPAAPLIAITKTSNPPGALTPGGSVTYTITASNGGSVDAPNTLVHDEFPAGIADATWTCTASGGVVCPAADSGGTVAPPAAMLDQTIATFPPGSSLTWTVIATVNANPPAQVINTASATAPEGGLCLPGNTPGPCQATVMNPPGPIVDIAKSADVALLIPGGNVTYTVTVRNSGTVPADGTTLDDPLPAGLAATTWTCTANGGAICPSNSGSGAIAAATIATFPVGGQLVYTIVATVDANPPANVTNTATIAPPPDGICNGAGPRPCEAAVTLPVAAQIGLTKSVAETEAVPGGPLTWTVTVTNTGQADAANTVVTDPLPAGVDPASATWTCAASNGGACPNASGSGALDESIAVFPPGAQLVYTLTATVSATPPQTIVNTASAVPPGAGRCTPDNALPPCNAGTTTPTAANVSLVKTVADASNNGIAEPGEQLTYTIVLSNSGGTAATNYGVTDPLDANTAFVSADNGGTFSGGTVTWTGLTVPAGGTLTLTVIVTVNNPIPSGVMQIANLAYHTGDTPPDCTVAPRPAGCTEIPTAGAVHIAKSVADASGNGIAEPGETLTYTITLTNQGGSAVTGYGVTDPLDANTTFVSADNGGALSGSTVTWSGLSVAAGATLNLTVVVTVHSPLPSGVTQIGNLAYHTGDVPPDCSVVPRPSACTSIPTRGFVTITKSVADTNGNGRAEPGEQLIYTIELRNGGGTDVTGYGVTDPLDANTTFVSASDGGTHSGGVVTWSGLTVPAGGSLTLDVVVTVNATIPDGVTQIGNLAYQTGGTPPDCNAVPRPDNCTSIPVVPTPASVAIAKTASSAALSPSGQVVYTVTVRNTGTTAATNVAVADAVPAGINAFAWTCAASGGGACPNASGSGALAQTIASLPVGGQLVYTIAATIAAEPPTSIVNTANVSLTNGTCAPCSATVTGQVQTPQEVRPVPAADRWALWLLTGLIAAVGLTRGMRRHMR